jgi:hypothetical protein
VGITPPTGYSIVGTYNGSTSSTATSISFSPLSSNPTVAFCIAPIKPWFQTDTGDVRFYNLNNPIPTGKLGSSSSTYPGIFYSSNFPAKFGDGAASSKGWIVNSEYNYNKKTTNRNGGLSYDFYKAKAKQEGVTVDPIDDGIVDLSSLTQSGVYEVKGAADGGSGNIIINSSSIISNKHIVLLSEGDVTINANILVTKGSGGLLVIAAKGSITVAPSVTTLEGYYSAQKDIILESIDSTNTCKTKDTQLLVNGALIANALKPFATGVGGTVQNYRSLCIDNLTTPSLVVTSRPDFLTQLTDFYKTSYTKWSEVNP